MMDRRKAHRTITLTFSTPKAQASFVVGVGRALFDAGQSLRGACRALRGSGQKFSSLVQVAFRRRVWVTWLVVAICLFGWRPGVGVVGAQEELPTALSGFEPSEQFDFEDDASWDPDSSFVIRLLHRAGRVSSGSWERFSRWTRDVAWKDLVELAPRYRFHVVQIEGRVKRIEPVRLGVAMEEDGAVRRGYYLVWIERSDASQVVAACREIPSAWREIPDLDEPTRWRGFFLGRSRFPPSGERAGDAAGDSVPVIVTNRPSWFPDRPRPEFGVPDDWVQMARLGVDIGLFDLVRRHQNQPLTEDDAAAMLALLRAVDSLSATQVPDEATDWLAYLAKPTEAVGRIVSVDGHVRRVHWIRMDDPQRRELLGVDGYYELDVFVPLGNRKVSVRQRAGDGDGQPVTVEYEHRFPVTICVQKIPVNEDELRGKRIQVVGVLLRFWNYESEYVSRVSPNAGQISPLIIGATPHVDTSSREAIDWFLGSALGLMAVAAALTIWYYRRTDRVVTNPVLVRWLDRPERLEGVEAIEPPASEQWSDERLAEIEPTSGNASSESPSAMCEREGVGDESPRPLNPEDGGEA